MARITVRAHPRDYPRTFGIVGQYRVEKAWQIYLDGEPLNTFVVDAIGLYRTIVDYAGQMLTSWHVGISPGDLARAHYRVCQTED